MLNLYKPYEPKTIPIDNSVGRRDAGITAGQLEGGAPALGISAGMELQQQVRGSSSTVLLKVGLHAVGHI